MNAYIIISNARAIYFYSIILTIFIDVQLLMLIDLFYLMYSLLRIYTICVKQILKSSICILEMFYF